MFRGIRCGGDEGKLWVMKFPKEGKGMHKHTTVGPSMTVQQPRLKAALDFGFRYGQGGKEITRDYL